MVRDQLGVIAGMLGRQSPKVETVLRRRDRVLAQPSTAPSPRA
jgi:hypothetical protein